MAKAFIFRARYKRMDPDGFLKIARTLGVSEKFMQSDEGLAVNDGARSLVYSQPGTKFGGLLFYTDQSQSLGAVCDKLVDDEAAKAWAYAFLKDFDLLPHRSRDERIVFKLGVSASPTKAVSFDGREKHKVTINTEFITRLTLNRIPITGPRAKIRMAFKQQETPIMILRGIWEDIEIFDEKEIVPEAEIVKAVSERLVLRRNDKANYRMVDIKLAYFAGEFHAEPDLLEPYYFVEVEFDDPKAREVGIKQGPRQMLRLPACR